jgi:hypothetical protein
MSSPCLKSLLQPCNPNEMPGPEKIGLALALDRALTGRAACDEQGVVLLTGAELGPPPASLKERRRWEIHLRLRLTAEFGEGAAARIAVRWADYAAP